MPYYVYIMTTRNNTALYTGVTGDLVKRVAEHKQKLVPGFTRKYHVDKLVFYQVFEDVIQAIAMEKRIKAGSRLRKIALIRKMNKPWNDLSVGL